MMDLDMLLDEAFIEGALAAGTTPEILAARFPQQADHVMEMAPILGKGIVNWNRTWTTGEERRLDEELGVYPIEEIARRHGRTPAAIKIRYTRLGLEAPSKRNMTALDTAGALGMDVHSIVKLIESGSLPAEKATEKIWAIQREKLVRWAVNPMNWMCFKLEKVQDEEIKRLVARQRERWTDEWWSTGQVGAYHGFTSSAVNNRIHKGLLPAVRWGNWWVLRSDAVKCHFAPPGRNGLDWSEAGDAFIVLGRAVGLPIPLINELRGQGDAGHRLRCLMRDEEGLRQLVLARGLQVYIRDGRVWADWRQHRDRFPGLTRAIGRFLTGEKMKVRDRVCVRGVMHSWMAWFAGQPWLEATAEMQETEHRLKYGNTASAETLRADCRRLRGWGIDPFGGELCS
jgi:hypothetical protein